MLFLDECERTVRGFIVHRLHAFLCQWPGVIDLLATVRHGKGVDHTTRTILLAEFRILRIVLIFRFFLGIEVIQVAKELVETVIAGQQLLKLTIQIKVTDA